MLILGFIFGGKDLCTLVTSPAIQNFAVAVCFAMIALHMIFKSLMPLGNEKNASDFHIA